MAAAAKTSAVERDEGGVSVLDGVFESGPDAVHAADEVTRQMFREFREAVDYEAMSRAVILGRAGPTPPLDVRYVLDEQRRRREDRGEAEHGWVNAHEDHLWPVEQDDNMDFDDGWVDADAAEP